MKKLISAIIAFVLGFSLFAQPAMATASPVQTFGVDAAILTGCAGKENGSGEGIKCVIQLVVDVLSVGAAVFAVIGIVITGIQYLTAGGNEEQTRKAKRRMFEIIIGIVVYAVGYSLLRWLLPGFN